MSEHSAASFDVDQARAEIVAALDQYPALNLHLVSAHCNAAALTHTDAEAAESHTHEHDGPGTIRNHPRGDLFYDPQKIADVLIESVEDEEHPHRLLRDLMRRPDTIITMAADEHTHTINPDHTWEVCPQGQGCTIYPRYFSAQRTVHADGSPGGAHHSTAQDVTEDISIGFINARHAMNWTAVTLEAVDGDRHSRLVKMLTDAVTQFNHSIQLLQPYLYPDSDLNPDLTH